MKTLKILFKQNRLLNTIAILVSILFFSLLYILVVNLNQANIDLDTAKKFKGVNVYQISDDLIGERETEYFANINSYDTLNRLNKKLNQSEDFTYYSVTWQPIYVGDFKGDEKFDPYYNIGRESPPHEMNGKPFSGILSVQVNDSVFEMNNLKIKEGNLFSEDDYLYDTQTETIPLILGYDYQRYYQIGDSVDIFLYDKYLKGNIIGFLEPSQRIFTANEPELVVDKYVLMPALNFKNDPSDSMLNSPENELFVRATLLSRFNSLLLTQQSPLEIKKLVEDISKEFGFSDYQIIGANGLKINTLANMTEANVTLIFIVIFILFLLMLFTYFMTLSIKVKKNIDVYTVFLICGANIETIKRYVGREFICISIIGLLIPILPFMLISSGSINIFMMYLIISIVFTLVVHFFVRRYIQKLFNKIDIVQRLKR